MVSNIREFAGAVPQVDGSAWVDPSATVIGQVRLDADVSVWPHVVIRGDIHAISIGARSNIQDGSVLHVTHDSVFHPGGYPLTIGEEVIVGHLALLHGCTICNSCLIGMGSVVMDGAVVEAETILGAGSLVSPGKVLPGGFLWMGRPARNVRAITEREREHLRYSARHYVTLKDRHRQELERSAEKGSLGL